MEAGAVSNVDRLVLLLRERLAERAKAQRTGRPSSPAARPDGIRALAAVEQLDDRHLRRALVQNILAESFGEALVNDAKFQQVVDRVNETIEADPAGARMLQRLADELKSAARR